MAEGKKSFILYADYIHTFNKLPDETAGKLIKYIFSYVNDENPVTDDMIVEIAFEPIKQQMKRDLRKWEQTSSSRSETGRLGGIKSGEARQRKSKQNEANEAIASKRSKTKQNEHVNVNDTVNVNVTVNNKYNIYISTINKILNTNFRLTDKIKPKITKILKEFTIQEIETAVKNAKKDMFHIENNFKYLTSEFFTRSDKVETWLNNKGSSEENSHKLSTVIPK